VSVLPFYHTSIHFFAYIKIIIFELFPLKNENSRFIRLLFLSMELSYLPHPPLHELQPSEGHGSSPVIEYIRTSFTFL